MSDFRQGGEQYRDRAHAGRVLAAELARYAFDQPLVLALPRGGVPVGFEVARALNAPLDVWVARKLGAPFQPEFGIGAIAEGGGRYVDWDDAARAGASHDFVDEVSREETVELARRVALYRGGRPPPSVQGRIAIVVDDGIATGRTFFAALQGIRRGHPARIVAAVPVASTQSLEEVARFADEVICPQPEPHLFAIGEFYEDFRQTSDAEVLQLLERARTEREAAAEQPLA